MAAQTVYLMGMGMFSPTAAIPMEEDSQGMTELPSNELPAPQLVMLANVAVNSEGNGCENMAEEKEMMELKTVGTSCYSDSEDESVIRYSYENHREICIIDYPESPQPAENHRDICIIDYPESPPAAVAQVEMSVDEIEEEDDDGGVGEEEEEEEGEVIEDLSKPANQQPSSPTTLGKRKNNQAMGVKSAKKKKPFHCKACNYQAMCEEEFVQHIRIHSANKMVVVRRVEGVDKEKATEALPGLEFEPAVDVGDIKGVIRCERCGYNTNRYDHYIAHLKHHSKEGDNHRVYKCVICTYTTVSQYHWRKHLRNHFPSKLFTCSHCCYFSDRKNNYVQHIRTHTGERPFQCSQCEYSSSQKTHLTRHMRTHSGERPFKCDSCNYLAANQHEVTRHARQVHNGPKPLCCPYCQYKTADRSNFKKHVELHLNPRQFLCPVCKYAASKKCNLQYHIKSRHPGCNIVNMDVSKVKLRAKKLESETDELEKLKLSGMEEDQDMEDEEKPELSDADKQSSPINLSTKSSMPNPIEAVESGTFDKTHKKSEATPNKEKPRKAKDKVEKKAIPKQKKTEKGGESTKMNAKIKQKLTKTVAAAESADCVKKSNKRQKTHKASPHDKTELKETKEKVKKASLEMDVAEKERDGENGLEKNPQKGKSEDVDRVERERERGGRLKKLNIEREGKESNNSESEKNGRSKTVEVAEKIVSEPPESKEVPAKNQGAKTKSKATKRKAAEALDLSTKVSPEEPCTSKGKRLKVKATDKQQSKSSNPQRVLENTEPGPVSAKEGHANEMTDLPAVVKLKKTKKTNKKGTVVARENNTCPATENSSSPLHSKKCPSTEIQQSSDQNTVLTLDTQASATDKQLDLAEQEAPKQLSLSKQEVPEQLCVAEQEVPKQLGVAEQEAPPAKETPSTLEKAEVSHKTGETTEVSSSCHDETPSPTEGDSSPTFRQPQAKPTSPSLELPGLRDKPADAEEDEGIHSHDGGSDISDSASEGSDDSGLNGLRAGKMADPETPTDEMPTPTELKSHTCIFCDRTFPLEVEYRRHLNRHLVNVYYLDGATEAGQ